MPASTAEPFAALSDARSCTTAAIELMDVVPGQG